MSRGCEASDRQGGNNYTASSAATIRGPSPMKNRRELTTDSTDSYVPRIPTKDGDSVETVSVPAVSTVSPAVSKVAAMSNASANVIVSSSTTETLIGEIVSVIPASKIPSSPSS